MEKFTFKGNGWVELTSNESIYRRIAEENGNMFFYNEKEKILVFKGAFIKRTDIVYIGSENGEYFLNLKSYQIKRIIVIDNNSHKKTILYNKNYESKENSTLCGNKFIGEYLVIASPDDLMFGDVLERNCDNCFYKPTKNKKYCNIITGKGNIRPRTLFRRRKNENMIPIIDQKEVAQYCKYFAHWDLE